MENLQSRTQIPRGRAVPGVLSGERRPPGVRKKALEEKADEVRTRQRLMAVWTLWGSLATGCAPAPADAPLPVGTAADSLRATWRLLPYPRFAGADSVRPPFGKMPAGYLVYDATGHMFWQVVNRKMMDSLELGLRRGVPDSVLLRLSKGFNGQFGTYTVDVNERTVTHQYEGGSAPWGRSVEVATPFRLSADSLFIGRDTLTWLRFIKVR